jgi:hypothetical protein
MVSQLCTPAIIYIIISVITIILLFVQGFTIITLINKILFMCIWAWILNYTCSKGYTNISWIMVLLPYVIMFGMLALVLEFTNKINGYLSNSIVSSKPYNQPLITKSA